MIEVAAIELGPEDLVVAVGQGQGNIIVERAVRQQAGMAEIAQVRIESVLVALGSVPFHPEWILLVADQPDPRLFARGSAEVAPLLADRARPLFDRVAAMAIALVRELP